MALRSSNPTFSEKIFERASNGLTEKDGVMTVSGTINKAFILLLILLAAAIYTWNMVANMANSFEVMPYLIGGAIGGLVMAIIMVFKPSWAFVLAPLYAVCEGLFIGGISGMYNNLMDGIVMQAAGLTFGTLGVMLLLYRFRIIRVTEKLKAGIFAATGAVALFYLVMMVVRLFGGDTSFYASSSPLSIGISLVIVAIAAFNLLLDFDFIEKGSEMKAPKYMEWYGAFGLLVTLVWLYLEILRLLSKLRN